MGDLRRRVEKLETTSGPVPPVPPSAPAVMDAALAERIAHILGHEDHDQEPLASELRDPVTGLTRREIADELRAIFAKGQARARAAGERGQDGPSAR